MLKKPTFWFLTVSFCVGMVLFRIKYEVIALEQHNVRVKTDIQLNKNAIHILKAELTHLNDPKRLQTLSQKYLSDLKPIVSHQMITFQDMTNPMRSEKIESVEKGTHQNALDAYINSSLNENENEGVHA
ncbi:MAG: hypothetical protein Q8S21_02965 [Candidatus Paracaedibacteraceae bacterium]|nr:hypothetical protein [Candidatus Paracaedibacteraceae bacterium]